MWDENNPNAGVKRRLFQSPGEERNQWVTPFQCHICSKYFPQTDSLKKHSRVHHHQITEDDPKKSLDESHAQDLDKNKDSGFICDYCSRIFTSKPGLTRHKKTHIVVSNNNSTHQCQHCGKKFYHKVHLTKHIRIHAGGGKNACKSYDQVFTSKANRTAHERTHVKRSVVKIGFIPVSKEPLSRDYNSFEKSRDSFSFAKGQESNGRSSGSSTGSHLELQSLFGDEEDTVTRSVKYNSSVSPLSSLPPPSEESSESHQSLCTNISSQAPSSSVNTFRLPVKKRHRCCNCGKLFALTIAFNLHKTGCKDTFKCGYCPFECVLLDELTTHLSDHRRQPKKDERMTLQMPCTTTALRVNGRNFETSHEVLSYRLCKKCKYFCETDQELSAHLNLGHCH